MLEAIDVARHLLNNLVASVPNYKKPSEAALMKWARDIDRAIRIDKRTKSQLIEAIDWIHSGTGTFWISNIMSGKKLREQFDKITAQRKVSQPTVPIRTRALKEFGLGKVFFAFKDTSSDTKIHACLFGDYGSLYDYNRNKYIDKVTADKVWKYIEKNFDEIVENFKSGKVK